MTTIEAPVIEWRPDDTASNCEWPLDEFARRKLTLKECKEFCSETVGCTHFTWTVWQGSYCFLKSGASAKEEAQWANVTTTNCGIMDPTGKDWNFGCDFPGNDIKELSVESSMCPEQCAKEPGCTHYVWNEEMQVCTLKDESITMNDSVPAGKHLLCGVVSPLNGGSSLDPIFLIAVCLLVLPILALLFLLFRKHMRSKTQEPTDASHLKMSELNTAIGNLVKSGKATSLAASVYAASSPDLQNSEIRFERAAQHLLECRNEHDTLLATTLHDEESQILLESGHRLSEAEIKLKAAEVELKWQFKLNELREIHLASGITAIDPSVIAPSSFAAPPGTILPSDSVSCVDFKQKTIPVKTLTTIPDTDTEEETVDPLGTPLMQPKNAWTPPSNLGFSSTSYNQPQSEQTNNK